MTLFLEADPPFDLIISDVIMPKMSGPGMVKRLRAEGREPLVLFISGYADDALAGLQEMGDDVAFMEKPFSPKDLRRKVRTRLDTRPRKHGLSG